MKRSELSAAIKSHTVEMSSMQSLLDDAGAKRAGIKGMEAEMQTLTDDLKAAKASKDEAAVKEILEARLPDVIAKGEKRVKDVNEMVMGLKLYFEQLGVNITSLDQLTPEEASMISAAEANIADAKEAVEDAKTGWFPIGKEGRIKAAEDNLEVAEKKLDQTQEEVKRSQRQRLLNADLQPTLQAIQAAAAETISALIEGRSKIEEQISVLESEQQRNNANVEQLTQEMKTLSEQVELLESEKAEAELELGEWSKDQPEYAEQQTKVTDVTKRLEDAQVEKNDVLAALQKEEKYVEELQTYVTAQKKSLGANRTMTTMLQKEVEQGAVTFEAWVSAKQSSTTLEAADTINKLTVDVRHEALTEVAEIGVAADRVLTETLEAHSSAMEVVMAIKDAQAEAGYKLTERQKQVYAEIANKHGIDPSMGTLYGQMNAGS